VRYGLFVFVGELLTAITFFFFFFVAGYRAMDTGNIFSKALEFCVTPTRLVNPRFQETLNAVRVSLMTD
jgi:hypothetical protein